MQKPFSFPDIDARTTDRISDEDVNFFLRQGVLLLKNVISPEELKVLGEESMALLRKAVEPGFADPDYLFAFHSGTGTKVPFRIDYVTDKMRSARVLMGHPFILRAVERIAGPSFIPTWESKVFKAAGAGAAVNWHRDSGPTLPDMPPVFFADIYLDNADAGTALRAIPGSHLWSNNDAMERITALNRTGQFEGEDMVTLPMTAGDVLLHNVHILHGSPAAAGALRRGIYFAFR